MNTIITSPRMPGRDDEVVGRVLEVMQEVAVEQRLAVLLQAQRGVQLGLGLARQHAGQEIPRRPTAPPCPP